MHAVGLVRQSRGRPNLSGGPVVQGQQNRRNSEQTTYATNSMKRATLAKPSYKFTWTSDYSENCLRPFFGQWLAASPGIKSVSRDRQIVRSRPADRYSISWLLITRW